MVIQPAPPHGEDGPPWTDAAAAPSWRTAHSRARWRLSFTAAALILGLCGLAGSAAGVVTQFLPRSFSTAQERQIMNWEMSRRWRTIPAGKIFPAAVTYQLSGLAPGTVGELALTAHRLGIARQRSCATAADPAAARILDRLGCAAVLRATYADSTSSMIVTVGVAVLPDNVKASAAAKALAASGDVQGGQLPPGLRPAAFAGTLAADFGRKQRQLNWDGSAGPYLIMSTAGYADGRPQVRVSSDAYTDQEMSSLAHGVADAIRAPLQAPPRVPHCPGAPGC